jgi:hypothetical protein
MRGVVWVASLAAAVAGCSGEPGPPPDPVTFVLQNGGTPLVFLYESCLLDLNITQLADPPRLVGRVFLCPACDCAASSCVMAVCGACYEGPREITTTRSLVWNWVPVDMTLGMRGAAACSHNRTLPPGRYRIDVPVYDLMTDAAAKTNARIAAQTFDLPAAETVVVELSTP